MTYYFVVDAQIEIFEMKPGKSAEKKFLKKFRESQFGYPIGTITYYDPDDQTATKVVVGIVGNPFIY